MSGDSVSMPTSLPFGSFLVQHGHVMAAELEAVLLIQGDRRAKLGGLARRHSYLNFDKICHIREIQQKTGQRFGEVALQLGYLNEIELRQLLGEQQSNHVLLGDILVELNILSRAQLAHCLASYQQYVEACQKPVPEAAEDTDPFRDGPFPRI